MSNSSNKTKIGKPRIYNTVNDMQLAIDNYFNDCKTNDIPVTITGLCLALGFTTRQGLLNYEGYTDDNNQAFVDIIKRAKLRVENAYELRCLQRGSAGDIFTLKQFGWSDRQTIEHSGDVSMSLSDADKKLLDNLAKRQK